MLYQKQPGNKGSCNYKLVDMIRVCGSVHVVRVRPEGDFVLPVSSTTRSAVSI